MRTAHVCVVPFITDMLPRNI